VRGQKEKVPTPIHTAPNMENYKKCKDSIMDRSHQIIHTPQIVGEELVLAHPALDNDYIFNRILSYVNVKSDLQKKKRKKKKKKTHLVCLFS
jgi:hypothetical protein